MHIRMNIEECHLLDIRHFQYEYMYTFKVYLLSLYTDVQSILPSLRLSNRTCIYMVSAFMLLSYEEEIIVKIVIILLQLF